MDIKKNVKVLPTKAPRNAPRTKIVAGDSRTCMSSPHESLSLGLFIREYWNGITLMQSTDTFHSSSGVYFRFNRFGAKTAGG